jgi:hypothetical protein
MQTGKKWQPGRLETQKSSQAGRQSKTKERQKEAGRKKTWRQAKGLRQIKQVGWRKHVHRQARAGRLAGDRREKHIDS